MVYFQNPFQNLASTNFLLIPPQQKCHLLEEKKNATEKMESLDPN